MTPFAAAVTADCNGRAARCGVARAAHSDGRGPGTGDREPGFGPRTPDPVSRAERSCPNL